MDMLRSCYSCKMRFEPGGAGIPVRWFFAKPGAKPFPGEHGYFSLNWEDPRDAAPVGEDRALMVPKWANGQGPALLSGQCVECVDPNLFHSDGVPPGIQPSRAVSSSGAPVTCLRAKVGGLSFTGKAKVLAGGGCSAAHSFGPVLATFSGCSGVFAPAEGETAVLSPIAGGAWTVASPPSQAQLLCQAVCSGYSPSTWQMQCLVHLNIVPNPIVNVFQLYLVTWFPPILIVSTYLDMFGNGFTVTFHQP